MEIFQLPEPIITDVVEAPVLLGTGIVSFTYVAPSALSSSQSELMDNLLLNARAVEGTWTSATSIGSNTRENQMTEVIEWLNTVEAANEFDFVIKETLPLSAASDIESMEYLYQNSEVFRTMSPMKSGVFQVENGQCFSGFGSAYESDMMQRTAVMVDNDEPVTLELDYQLSQGKMAVWLVNPSGKLMCLKN